MKKIASAITGYLRATDKWLLLFWVGASAVSVLFLYGLHATGFASEDTVTMHIFSSGLGLAAALIISMIDYHLLLKLWRLYVPVCLILVGMTFFAGLGGTVRGDNMAWLNVKLLGQSFSIQPSEFLKIAFITTFALHIAKVKEELNRLPNILALCLHGAVPVLIIQYQGDSGSALIFLGIFLAMLFCAGINWRYILAAALALAAAVPILWFYIMTDDQKMRFLVVSNPELSESYAWQQQQAISALGYGGMEGTGIFAGRHIYVAEAYNDFIFSFIGESTGFIGCLGVIVLLAAISFKILYNSRLAADDEGRFICIGLFAMIVCQTIINLGMCLSLLPVIGVTLPLFSSGGTSVLSLYLGLGLVLSVYGHPKTDLFSDKRR